MSLPIDFVVRTVGRSIAVLTIVGASCVSTCADWPLERGDALATGVAKSAVGDSPEVLWKYTLDESGFEATAVIADGKVFVGDVDGTFHAVRLADGKKIWKRSFEDTGFLVAAAVAQGRIYVSDFNGLVRSLNVDDGQLVWWYQTKAESYAGPNVLDGRVLVTTNAGELVTLDAEMGELQWQFSIDAPLQCWPTVVDGRVLLAGCDEVLHAVDVQTGEEVTSVAIDGPTGSTPAIWDGHAMFGTEQGTFYSIAAKSMEINWRYQDATRIDPIRTAAAADHGVAIFANKGKQVVAVDPATGERKWDFATRSEAESSPVIAGDLVFFGTKRGRLHALEVATGEEKWQYQAGGSFKASPAVTDGRLVIGNIDGTLYCFGKPPSGQ